MAFNFGSTPFGSTTTSTTKVGFGQPSFSFGSTNATTTTASTGFSFGSSTTPSGFGNTTSNIFGSSFGGGFGTTTTTVAPFNFSSTATTTTQSLFGQTPTATVSGFGSFGAKPFGTQQPSFATFNTGNTGFGFGGFGAKPATSNLIAPNTTLQPVNQVQQPTNPNEIFLNSVFNCNIFGDERDQIMIKWNLLQAVWGTGKGYFNRNAPPMEYNSENILCKFKSIGYCVKPSECPNDGLVAIHINKKAEEIRSQQTQFESSLSSILGNKPNLTVFVDCVRPLPDSKSVVLIYVQEKAQNGITRRIPNTELCSFLLQPTPKQQLVNLSVNNVYCYNAPKYEQLSEYYQHPPAGIDERLWKQGQNSNPDKERFVQVPILGFNDLRWRTVCQEKQITEQTALLDKIAMDIEEMRATQTNNVARIIEYKQKLLNLQHRIIKVLVKMSSCYDRSCAALGADDENLKIRLETLQNQLNKSGFFKQKMTELAESLKLMDINNKQKTQCELDENFIQDIEQFLSIEQNAISELNNLLRTDADDLKGMLQDIKKFPPISAPAIDINNY